MGFTNSLKTEWVDVDGKLLWRVTESYEFHSGEFDSGLFIGVPEGFVSDLASIPFGARWLIPKAGKMAQAAVCHDKCYRDGTMTIRIDDKTKDIAVTSGMADSMMYQAMIALKVKKWRRVLVFRALKLGGWYRWNQLRKANIGTKTETTL